MFGGQKLIYGKYINACHLSHPYHNIINFESQCKRFILFNSQGHIRNRSSALTLVGLKATWR